MIGDNFINRISPVHEVLVLITSEDSGEDKISRHMRRLANVFTTRLHKLWMKMNAQVII